MKSFLYSFPWKPLLYGAAVLSVLVALAVAGVIPINLSKFAGTLVGLVIGLPIAFLVSWLLGLLDKGE